MSSYLIRDIPPDVHKLLVRYSEVTGETLRHLFIESARSAAIKRALERSKDADDQYPNIAILGAAAVDLFDRDAEKIKHIKQSLARHA